MFKRRPTQIGISIYDQQYRAVCITRLPSGPKVKASTIVDIETNSPADLQKALIEICSRLDYRSVPVIFALNNDDVVVKTVDLDISLSKKEILIYLQSQAHDLLGHPAKEIAMDFNCHASSNKAHQTVQVVATQKKQVHEIIELGKHCALKIKAIDVSTFAIQRVMNLLYGEEPPEVCRTILLLQKKQLLFCVFKSDKLLYSATIDYPVLTACHQALQYFNSAHPHHYIDKIILVGEYGSLLSIAEYLTRKFSLSVLIANTSYSKHGFLDSRLWVSLGAALWSKSP